MTEQDLDREITEDHEKIVEKIRMKLGDKVCPELVEMKAWVIQIARANDLVEGIINNENNINI